jgi:hypothetical protein
MKRHYHMLQQRLLLLPQLHVYHQQLLPQKRLQ